MALALAVGDEQERRHTAKAAQSASGAGAGRPRNKSSPKRQAQPTADTSPPLPKARVNAIRAAFKAGAKPAVIARQFGVSQQVIRQGAEGGFHRQLLDDIRGIVIKVFDGLGVIGILRVVSGHGKPDGEVQPNCRVGIDDVATKASGLVATSQSIAGEVKRRPMVSGMSGTRS